MNETVHKNGGDSVKIPVIIMDQHYNAYKFIKQYIENDNLLPKTGNTIIHLDAHIDTLVPDDLQIRLQMESKSTRFRLFGDIGVENWLQQGVTDNCFKHVVWVKPPWALQTKDGHYDLENNVTLDIKTLGHSIFNEKEDIKGFKDLFSKYITESDSYILDLEYNFFTSDNPFTTDYAKAIEYYSKLKELFKLKVPENQTQDELEKASIERQQDLEILYEIFQHLSTHRVMPPINDKTKKLSEKVTDLQQYLLKYYSEDVIDWKSIYDAGVMANDYILPVHHTNEADIKKIFNSVGQMLDTLPCPPKIITIAIMYEYDLCTPKKTLDFMADAVKEFFTDRYNNSEFIYFE